MELGIKNLESTHIYSMHQIVLRFPFLENFVEAKSKEKKSSFCSFTLDYIKLSDERNY